MKAELETTVKQENIIMIGIVLSIVVALAVLLKKVAK